MNTPARLATFGAVLAVVFGAAFGVGRLAGPDAVAEPAGDMAHPEAGGDPGAGHGGHGGPAATPTGTGQSGPAAHGYSVAVDPHSGGISFKIAGAGGRTVTGFATVHEKPLHLIVVRRDLSGFQHVHPVMDADGTWRAALALPDGGPWRAYFDFTETGAAATVLTADLAVPGAPHSEPLPPPSASAAVDGYTVRIDTHDGVALRVERDGRPVTDLQPYLGAAGHLVAIAERDLAYLHVHPTGPAGGGPEVRFAVEGAASGTHRLYFQFQHGGAVHTAEFTVTAIGGGHAHN
ncbi:hypothetical protein ACQEVZ_19895 [Dactylosporangium sp. CA-152071]|uniref:hypothetical protein n=1 Tax=Dactylosporangium sp. CA-152071 TaxID=3239933 RepID=UPI003D8B34BF